MTVLDERGLPATYEPCLPQAFDRRVSAQPVVFDRRAQDRKLAEDVRGMRERMEAKKA